MAPAARYTLRDEALAHQIVLLLDGISCNCRRLKGGGHETFADLADDTAAWIAYLKPENHDGTF